jgi:hypothetical protein
VNSKTLGRIFMALCLCAALTVRASDPQDLGDVVSMGNDTYSITREARNAFTRDTDRLKSDVSDAAARFCAAQGRQLKVISLTGNVPLFGTGYAKVKIIFQSLNAGDPGLSSQPAYAQVAPAAAPPAEKSLSTDDLVAALTKLDDLRKRGILTDDEFQSEKKKLLNHSK